MATRNSDYWTQRFQQLEEAQHQSSEKLADEIQLQMRKAEAAIENKINAWYGRLAVNNNISMAEAKKLLNAKELEEFRWEVEDYIWYGEKNALNGQWMNQLENTSARAHISRLEQLKLQVQQESEKLYGNYLDQVDIHMKSLYEEGFYRTAYEIQKGIGVGWNLAGVDTNKLEKIIKKPWAADGKNFSDRIWSSKQQLIDNLHTSLTQMCILGQSPDKAIASLAKAMKTSKSQAGRVIMTESAFFSSEAQKDCFKELDVEEYEIVATLDSYTSDICKQMDGKHFPMNEFKVGVTAPPFHVRCRTCTCPYFNDEFSTDERAARGGDGKTYYVSSSMKYPEWKQTFVDSDKVNLQPTFKNVKIEPDKYIFQEARTIKEANAYAENVLGLKADYHGCDIKSANEWNKGVTEYFNKFKELKKNFGFIGDARQRNKECKKIVYEYSLQKLRDLNPNCSEEKLKKYAQKQADSFVRAMRVPKNTFAQSWSPGEGLFEEYRGICLNSDWGKNPDLWTEALKKDVESQFHPIGCDTIKSILDHEMGHQLDELLRIREIREVKALFDTRTFDELTADISRYSWNNDNPNKYSEMIAEAWAEYCNNPNPREIARTVGRTIKSEYSVYIERLEETKELGLR